MNNNDSSRITPERYAPHLSEFYPIMNNNNSATQADDARQQQEGLLPNQIITSPQRSDHTTPNSRFQSLSSRNSMRRPSSVASNSQSIMSDLQTLITRHDVKQTKDAMKSLNGTSRELSDALATVARCSSKMAGEFENFAHLKGCNDDTAEKFMNASGLFHLVGNHDLIMSEFINDLLIDSVTDMMDEFQFKSKSLENQFNRKRKEESLKLKIQEKFNNDFSRRNVRNLISYRESLNNLQNQLDQLELLKYDYYNDSYQLVESTCNNVLKQVASITRAQVEISENIARKGWSGGGLDDLLIDAEDPFTKNEEEEEEEEEGEGDEEEEDQTDHIMNSIPEEGTETDNNNSNTSSNKKIGIEVSNDDNLSNSMEQLGIQSTPQSMDNNNSRSIIGVGNSSNITIGNNNNNSSEENIDNEELSASSDNENDNSFALPLSNSVGVRTSSILEEEEEEEEDNENS